MIDYDAVISKFVRLAKTWLGDDVTKVIQSHPNAPQPQRPFVVVDILFEQDEDGYETHRYVNDDDNPVYETHKQILISYCVHGAGALTIANKLHRMFMLDRVRDEIRTDLEAGVVKVDNVRDIPKLTSDQLFDGKAEFEFVINIIDSVVDELGTIIEGAGFTVEIHDGEGDDDPFITEFEVDNIV